MNHQYWKNEVLAGKVNNKEVIKKFFVKELVDCQVLYNFP